MAIIPDNIVNTAINGFVYRMSYTDINMHSFCKFNSLFGFRYNELKQYERWTEFDADNYICNTEKNSNNRIISKTVLPIQLQDAILSQEEAFPTIRYSTFIRIFKKYFEFPYLSVGNKKVSSHIFRYNLVKQMTLQGYTIQQISDFLGEVDNKNTQGYLLAEFHT